MDDFLMASSTTGTEETQGCIKINGQVYADLCLFSERSNSEQRSDIAQRKSPLHFHELIHICPKEKFSFLLLSCRGYPIIFRKIFILYEHWTL